MAIYAVTPLNWNSAAFWSGISETTTGHELDFSGLTSGFRVDVGTASGTITLTDGSTTFTVGDASTSGTDATFGGTTLLSYFDTIGGGDGVDTLNGSDGDDLLIGGPGSDEISGGLGADSLIGGSGDDRFIVEDGYGNDTIEGSTVGETLGDVLDLTAVISDLTVDLSGGVDGSGVVMGADGNIIFTSIERIILGGANDTVLLGDGLTNAVFINFKAPSDNGDGTFSANDVLDVSGLSGGITTDDITVSDTVGDGTGDTTLTFPSGLVITLQGVPPYLVSNTLQLQAMGIPGGANDYVVEGTGGNDTIDAGYLGDPEGDRIDASDNAFGTDADYVVAGNGDDSVLAGAGDDTVYGGAGNDTLRGEAGSDLLVGGTGNDSMNGGADADIFRLTDGFDTDEADGGETVTTGVDHDVIDLSALSAGVVGALSGDEQGAVNDGASNLIFAEIEEIILTDQDDQFDTSAATAGMVVRAGGGNDTLIADGGNDSLYGGSGSDEFTYTTVMGGNDQIFGGAEGGDDDHLNLANLTQSLTVIYSGDGQGDVTEGANTTGFDDIERLTLGTQNDTVDASADTEGVNIDAADGDDSLQGGDGNDTLWGGLDNDSLRGGAGEDTLRGGEGNDTLVGNSDADELHGDEGNDTIFGGGQDDTVEAGTGDDYVEGGNQDDSINGDYGNDTIYGDNGNDFVRGSFGNDQLYGGEGDDYVWGGWGDDTIYLGNNFGNDTISGEGVDETVGDTLDLSAITVAIRLDLTNSDPESGIVSDSVSNATFEEIETIILATARTFIELADGSGADRVTGFRAPTDNGDGTFSAYDYLVVDGLTVDGGTTPVTVFDVTVTDTVGDGTGDAILTFPGGESLTLVGVLASAVSSHAQLEAMGIPNVVQDFIVAGTAAADLIDINYTSDPNNERVDNSDHSDGSDKDEIRAGLGDDTVYSGLGDDTILGGDGNDYLAGEAGADSILGEGGDDTIVVQGQDRAIGGETSETLGDLLDASGINGEITLNLTSPGAGSLVVDDDATVFSEMEHILLGSGRSNVAGSTGDDSIAVGAGADVVEGREGNDRLDLGADDGSADRLVFGDEDGNDTIIGFEAPTANPDGSFTGRDLLVLDGMTADGDLVPVNTAHVTVTDTVGDGSGDAILTFPSGASLTLVGVTTAQVATPAQLEAMGVPPAMLNFIVEGTIGDDVIDGTYASDPQGDRIDANDNDSGDNRDSVMAGDGDDTINAGSGDDTVHGEGGDDTFVILDAPGNDSLIGGETNEGIGDHIDASGLSGNTTLVMSADEAGSIETGASTVEFSEIERITLGAGDDSAQGGSGDDSIAGGAGTDTLLGGEGEDSLDGGAEADLLQGGLGNDRLFLGTDDGARDVVVLADGHGDDEVTGFEAPTDDGNGQVTGRDQIDVTGLTSDGGTTPVTVADVTVSDTNFDGTGDAILNFPGGESLTLIGVPVTAVSSAAQLVAMGIPAGPSTPEVTGTAGADLIDTTYTGDPEGDRIDAGDNNGSDDDLVNALAGDDTVDAGLGTDTVNGGSGNDRLTGGAGNDVVNGGDGNDTFLAEAGNDVLSGGADADRFVIDASSGSDTIFGGQTATTGTDTDVLDATGLTTGVTVTLSEAGNGTLILGNDTVTFSAIEQILTGSGADTLSAGAATTGVVLDAGAGNDNVTGGTGDDSLTAGSGNDTLNGGLGSDTLMAGDGADAVAAGAGNDVVSGGSGNDTIYSADGDDSITGDDGNDSLFGGTGNDTINGGAGADTLMSGLGDDVLSGGADQDLFVLTNGMGADTIFGGEAVTDGLDRDVIDATALTGPVVVTYTSTESGTVTDGTDTISFWGIEDIRTNTANDSIDVTNSANGANVEAGGGNDNVIGGRGDDTVDAGDGDDAVSGGDGNDTLIGGEGADTLSGGNGSDQLTGGLGNDQLEVGAGDTASGDDGDDIFNVDPDDMTGANSVIDGGENGETGGDTLNIFGAATLTMTGAESGIVTWLSGSTLTFSNIENVNFAACFTPGTAIKTRDGEIPVEDLQPGQSVLTRDAGYRPLRWIGAQHFPAIALHDRPHLAPIRIRAGALGRGLPDRDLIVSPQHRMLVSDQTCALWFDTAEVLVAAKDLTGLDGIDVVIPPEGITYVHILFDRHEIVSANGAWSESFQPGDLSLGGLDQAQRREITELFPQLDVPDNASDFTSARQSLAAYQAKALFAGKGA